MAIKRINRYCGIIAKKPLKKKISEVPWLVHTSQINEEIILLSSLPIQNDFLIDGYLSGTSYDDFDYRNVDNYDGNWSFFKKEGNNFILSRDRIGVRAMYFYENEDYFCFSNEIKSLLKTGLVPFHVSSTAAFQFLLLDRNEILGDNLFKDIKELAPSQQLTYNLLNHTYNVINYYVPKELYDKDWNVEEASTQIRKNLVDIIGNISAETSDLASLLSGGIDSSCIASAIYIKKKENEIPFLTAMSGDEELDEVDYAETVVRRFNISNWNQVLASNIKNELEAMHYAMELPTTSLGSFLQYELNRFASHYNIRYLLDGTGADALYAGHHFHHAVYWNSLIRRFSFGKAAAAGIKTESSDYWLKYWLRNLLKYYYLPQFSSATKLRIAKKNNPLLRYLNPDFVNQNHKILDSKSYRNMKDLNEFLSISFYGGEVKNLLRFSDRFGKFFGVSNLSVFSEYRSLYENAFQIPAHMKIRNGQLKFILRNAFKEFLPIEVLKRNDKKGLVAPNNTWIKENKDFLLSYFDDDLSIYFEAHQMKDALNREIIDLGKIENFKLFKFLSFAIWFRVFNKQNKE